MFELTCSNCGKKYNSRERKRYKNCFCCKQCESEFRKGKLNRPKQTNEIVIKDNFAIIKIQNNKFGKLDCLIDIDDVEKIKDYFWNIRYDKRHPNCTIYIETHKNKKRIHLHRLLTNCPKDMVVDHIDGNGLNNKKDNLRICNQSINCMNRTRQLGKFKIGVSFDNRRKLKKYNAYFCGKYLGSFLTENEAHSAYLSAKSEFFTNYKNADNYQQLNT